MLDTIITDLLKLINFLIIPLMIYAIRIMKNYINMEHDIKEMKNYIGAICDRFDIPCVYESKK